MPVMCIPNITHVQYVIFLFSKCSDTPQTKKAQLKKAKTFVLEKKDIACNVVMS